MEIKITCDGSDYIDFKKLKPFQGELKTITDDNLQKLKNSILKYGFTSPAFIWKENDNNWILDSHQRVKALTSLFSEGYTIPNIPVVYIQAKDEKEAKEKLLHISSQYGEFDSDGLADFLLEADIILNDLDVRLTNDEFNISIDEVNKTDEEYTKKIEAPIYEITGEKPEIIELVDTTKTDELIHEIRDAQIEDKELEAFLIHAADRHKVFTYSKIAEFYAHADSTVQELMEKSALIIIDFNQAIENGFVKLTEDTAKAYKTEEDNE